MSRDIPKDSVLSIIKLAFAPLECIAEFGDRKNRVSFSVYDKNGSRILNVENILTQRLQNAGGMKSIIGQSRKSLIEGGQELDTWQLSNADGS